MKTVMDHWLRIWLDLRTPALWFAFIVLCAVSACSLLPIKPTN